MKRIVRYESSRILSPLEAIATYDALLADPQATARMARGLRAIGKQMFPNVFAHLPENVTDRELVEALRDHELQKLQ